MTPIPISFTKGKRAPQQRPRAADSSLSALPALSCWSVGNGEVRIQANHPKHRKALHELKGFQRVGYSCTGPYCVIYQGLMSLTDAKAYIARKLTAA